MNLVSGIVIIIGLTALFLLLREIVCWYWKINERLENLETISFILNEILKELKNK